MPGSEKFSIQRGVRQGDVLSPLLFNAVLEDAIRKWKLKLTNEGLRLGQDTRLTNLRYADDLMIFATSRVEFVSMLFFFSPSRLFNCNSNEKGETDNSGLATSSGHPPRHRPPWLKCWCKNFLSLDCSWMARTRKSWRPLLYRRHHMLVNMHMAVPNWSFFLINSDDKKDIHRTQFESNA